MTNTYDTSNIALGSTAVKVLYNNASNFDDFLNGPDPSYPDRFFKRRQSWAGFEKAFAEFMENMGFEATHLTYVDGTSLTVNRPTQLIDYNGSVYKVKAPATYPLVLSGTWATDAPLLVDIGDASLRSALAASTGSTMIGDGASTVGAQLTTIRDQLTYLRTVEYYGAVGDGVTNDAPAFSAMHTALGFIRALPKAYMVNGLALTGSAVVVLGSGMPAANETYTALVGGTIFVGTISIRSNRVTVSDFGVDSGSSRGLGTTEGFQINSGVGEVGRKCIAQNISVLGANEVSTTHSLLVQGFADNEIENIDCALHQFGVVCKGRNGFIKKVKGYRIKTATVYPKSDLPAFGGDVADATAGNLIVSGVLSAANPANTECNAVYVHASTVGLSNVTVSDVQSTYGNSALRIAGGSDTSLVTSGVRFSNISSERAVRAVELFGYNYDTTGTNVSAVNPTSGEAVSTSGNSYNYLISDINVLISDPAITATSCSSFNGTGGFDNFTVRNPYRQMIVNLNIANSVAGAIQGDAKLSGTGTLTLANGWTAGTQVPVVLSGARNLISCRGWAMASGSSSNTIASFPLAQSPERFFPCAARKTDATYTTVVLYLSGTSLILQGDRTVLTYIDLSGIVFQA